MGHAESGTAEVYRIGELAAETELSRDTLRYYERLGVIAQPRRSRGGFRLYGRDAHDVSGPAHGHAQGPADGPPHRSGQAPTRAIIAGPRVSSVAPRHAS
ncbi:MAG TPA: MerR family DNA-binding transcriptional regulator [Acidobacteria bacterium]|nr:MerR family DNA-binding transcriptional regulator [Acidobacteriota bacterium]